MTLIDSTSKASTTIAGPTVASDVTQCSRDIPIVQENLSPALAAMMGTLVMPNQYAKIMRDAVSSVNSRSTLLARRIMK